MFRLGGRYHRGAGGEAISLPIIICLFVALTIILPWHAAAQINFDQYNRTNQYDRKLLNIESNKFEADIANLGLQGTPIINAEQILINLRFTCYEFVVGIESALSCFRSQYRLRAFARMVFAVTLHSSDRSNPRNGLVSRVAGRVTMRSIFE